MTDLAIRMRRKEGRGQRIITVWFCGVGKNEDGERAGNIRRLPGGAVGRGSHHFPEPASLRSIVPTAMSISINTGILILVYKCGNTEERI